MNWKIQIRASAKEDIKAIKQWYRHESIQALENFTKELTATFELLQDDQVDYKPVHKNFRRVQMKRFPYTIYYQRKEKELSVEINAVFHNHRDSNSIFPTVE